MEVHGQRAIRLKGGVRMAGLTVLFGGSLILLGVGSFAYAVFGEHREALKVLTALIPAAVGAILAVLGALSFKESRRKHTMHAAAGVASLTFMVCVWRVAPLLFKFVQDGEVSLAFIANAVTAVITLIFVLLCVRSFAQARRNRAKAETAKQPT